LAEFLEPLQVSQKVHTWELLGVWPLPMVQQLAPSRVLSPVGQLARLEAW
jgi:hypothetical protein